MDKTVFYVLILWFASSQLMAQTAAPDMSDSQPTIPQVLLDKVAEGDGESAYFIATAFAKGEGAFEVDLEKAKEWFKKAAELNNVHGMFELAMLLFFDKDYQSAQLWFEKAAEMGHGESFYRLGIYHIYGLSDLNQSCEAAYQQFESAQSRKIQVAFNDHAWMLATMPEKQCRNGEKAWRIYSELERSYGPGGMMPLSFLDTKAAVLAEISEFNEAIKLQTYVVEEFCGVYLKDSKNIQEWMQLASNQTPEFCAEGVLRLQAYINRKPWREAPQGDYEAVSEE
ncbi:tetratricopeptide repeat protein [Marinicella rhabdoformis]|uniref:tetratricopeptide repeat protein n=1 Tax=Marinicella rhabdoformis TaxID=2580566 RepID=UPI0012AEC24B|nr:tetratricopeptide repeat protein [Marinicella rhabdoformis]